MIDRELIHSLTKDFENFANKTSDDGIEFWLARDLQHLLDHFADVGKMVEIGLSATKKIYLIVNIWGGIDG